jgi:stage II sporulation protein D
VIARGAFVASAAAALLLPRAARAQSDADPELQARTPSLRVLLGPGNVQPQGPSGFIFNGRAYRGDFERIDGGDIVNLIDIEQYLYSVVPREMPPAWPQPALQAQAICARTFVLQRSNPRRAYDLVPSEIDQVYEGVAGESPAGRLAVDATASSVLRFNHAFAMVAYSSCCGGHTESSADAWGGVPIPYLQGVPCPYCTASPNYRWTVRLALASVARVFARQLEAVGALRGVQIAQRDASGRALAFELVAEQGSVSIQGTAFRLAVGARLVRSLLVTAIGVEQPDMLVLEGAGLGHGVGMCQWGARGMALAGHTASDILALYFPGTHVSSASND